MEKGEDVEFNFCGLYKHVESVRPLDDSHTASRSEQWLLTLRDSSFQDLGQEVKTMFAKLWVSQQPKLDQAKVFLRLQMLDYEALVYRQIIGPLIQTGVCPHFVNFHGGGTLCSFPQILKLVSPTEEPRVRNILINKFKHTLSSQSNKSRPRFTDKFPPSVSKADQVLFGEKTKYNFLLLENMQGLLFYQYMRQVRGSDFWVLLFQSLAAANAMAFSKLDHQDLHNANTWVLTLPETKRWIYQYNHKEYCIETNLQIKIFDFDRGYARQIGPNPGFVPKRHCFFQENNNIPNRDIVRILFNFWRFCPREHSRTTLLEIFCPNKKITKLLHAFFQAKANTHQQKRITQNMKGQTLPPSFYLNFHSPEKTLDNCAKLLPKIKPTKHNMPPTSTFVCNKDMFDSNTGKLKG